MIIYLLFYLLCIPFNSIHAASLAINSTPKKNQNVQQNTLSNTATTKTEADELNDDDDHENTLDKTELDEADESDDLDLIKPSFRTKVVRAIRSIKKHSGIIITTVIIGTCAYLYWYKLWPFSASQSTDTSHDNINDNDEQLTITNEDSTESNADKNETTVEMNKKDIDLILTENNSVDEPPIKEPNTTFNFKKVIPIDEDDNLNYDNKKYKDEMAIFKNKHCYKVHMQD